MFFLSEKKGIITKMNSKDKKNEQLYPYAKIAKMLSQSISNPDILIPYKKDYQDVKDALLHLGMIDKIQLVARDLAEKYEDDESIQTGYQLLSSMLSGEYEYNSGAIMKAYGTSEISAPNLTLIRAWICASTNDIGLRMFARNEAKALILEDELTGIDGIICFTALLLYIDYDGLRDLAQGVVIEE